MAIAPVVGASSIVCDVVRVRICLPEMTRKT